MPGCRMASDVERRCRAPRVARSIWRTRSIRRRRCSARNVRRRRRLHVDEVPEHVHVRAFDDRRDLDAGHQLDPSRRGRRRRGLTAGHRVVVGDAQHGDAGRRRARDELRRRAPAVRRGGVGVEIDQRGALTDATFFGLRRAPRRSRSARYSPNQQIEVRALFVGELEEDALAFGVLEALAVPLEELVRPALALDADEQRLLIVDARCGASRSPSANSPLAAPLKKRNVGRDSSCGSSARSSRYRASSVPRCSRSSAASR